MNATILQNLGNETEMVKLHSTKNGFSLHNFFSIMQSIIYIQSILDGSTNQSEIRLTIIYHTKNVFICMSVKYLGAAHFMELMKCHEGVKKLLVPDWVLLIISLVALIESTSLDPSLSLWSKELLVIRNLQLATVTLQLALNSDLSKTNETAALGPFPHLPKACSHSSLYLEKPFLASDFRKIKKIICSWNNYGILAPQISTVLHN